MQAGQGPQATYLPSPGHAPVHHGEIHQDEPEEFVEHPQQLEMVSSASLSCARQ